MLFDLRELWLTKIELLTNLSAAAALLAPATLFGVNLRMFVNDVRWLLIHTSVPVNCIENATDLPISCNWSTEWPEILEFLLINVAFLANKKHLCKHEIVVHLTM